MDPTQEIQYDPAKYINKPIFNHYKIKNYQYFGFHFKTKAMKQQMTDQFDILFVSIYLISCRICFSVDNQLTA